MKRSVLLTCCLLLVLALVGCHSSELKARDEQIASLRSQIKKLQEEKEAAVQASADAEARIKKLEQELTNLRHAVNMAHVPSPSPGARDIATGLARRTARFTDLEGVTGEKEIGQLARLGVFEGVDGSEFHPSQSVLRKEFVRWLVRANNAVFAGQPDSQVKLADGGNLAFMDVPSNHPDFKYIQGMANGGFSIAHDERHFQPDRALTREEMVAIKLSLDRKASGETSLADMQAPWRFQDGDQVSARYRAAILADYYTGNIKRVYGPLETFHPRQAVTRAEAALCIWKVGFSPQGDAGAALEKEVR